MEELTYRGPEMEIQCPQPSHALSHLLPPVRTIGKETSALIQQLRTKRVPKLLLAHSTLLLG